MRLQLLSAFSGGDTKWLTFVANLRSLHDGVMRANLATIDAFCFVPAGDVAGACIESGFDAPAGGQVNLSATSSEYRPHSQRLWRYVSQPAQPERLVLSLTACMRYRKARLVAAPQLFNGSLCVRDFYSTTHKRFVVAARLKRPRIS